MTQFKKEINTRVKEALELIARGRKPDPIRVARAWEIKGFSTIHDGRSHPFVKRDPSPTPLPKRTVSYRLLDEEQRIKDSGYVPEFLPPEVPYIAESSGVYGASGGRNSGT